MEESKDMVGAGVYHGPGVVICVKHPIITGWQNWKVKMQTIILILKAMVVSKYYSEFAICHVVRHGNANSIQNPSTVTNPTMELYCKPLFFFRLRCRVVQRDKSQTH